MIKIKVGVQYPHGACSYYRSMGPFSKLHKLNSKIDVQKIDEIEWHAIADTDILYLERPAGPEFLAACRIAKDFNVKLWVDYDDNLFDIPEYNPCHDTFNLDVKKIIAQCVQLADIVTVATPELKNVYSNYNDNVVVIENAFNDYNFILPDEPSREEALLWRGSQTHRQDLLGVAEQVFKLAKEYPEWGWCFVGNDLWYMTDGIDKHYNQKELPVLKYFKFIKNTNPAIQFVPLQFNRFNVGKSNIAWIEGTYAGATCIGPDLPEWKRPGLIRYRDAKEFYVNLDSLIKDGRKRKDNFELSKYYIMDNLYLSKINLKRITVIERLLDV